MKEIKYKFNIGLALRSRFRHLIRESCFNLDLSLKMEEEKGWLGSTFFVTFSGEDQAAVQMETFLNGLIKKFGDSGDI
jgi:hypothetical protein